MYKRQDKCLGPRHALNALVDVQVQGIAAVARDDDIRGAGLGAGTPPDEFTALAMGGGAVPRHGVGDLLLLVKAHV